LSPSASSGGGSGGVAVGREAGEMKRVTYVRKGLVNVLKVPEGVALRLGGSLFRWQRWVVSVDIFRRLKAQNPEIKFVKVN
jgi:hypothetical protein